MLSPRAAPDCAKVLTPAYFAKMGPAGLRGDCRGPYSASHEKAAIDWRNPIRWTTVGGRITASRPGALANIRAHAGVGHHGRLN